MNLKIYLRIPQGQAQVGKSTKLTGFLRNHEFSFYEGIRKRE